MRVNVFVRFRTCVCSAFVIANKCEVSVNVRAAAAAAATVIVAVDAAAATAVATAAVVTFEATYTENIDLSVSEFVLSL